MGNAAARQQAGQYDCNGCLPQLRQPKDLTSHRTEVQ